MLVLMGFVHGLGCFVDKWVDGWLRMAEDGLGHVMWGDAWLVSWVGEQRVWRIRLPNAQSQLRELSARARSADFVLARFRSPCVGIDMGGCAGGLGRCAALVHGIGDLVDEPVF